MLMKLMRRTGPGGEVDQALEPFKDQVRICSNFFSEVITNLINADFVF